MRKKDELKIILIVLVSVLATIHALFAIRVIIFAIQERLPLQKSIDNYLSIPQQVFVVENPYIQFPSKQTVLSANHYNYCQGLIITPFIFLEYDDAVTYLSCEYNDEQFEEEIKRLDSISTVRKTEHFIFPAYILSTKSCYQYVLIDESSNTIYYVLKQCSRLFFKNVVPEELSYNYSGYKSEIDN